MLSFNIFHGIPEISKCSENSNCCKKLLFNARGLRHGTFTIFDMLISCQPFFYVIAHIKFFLSKKKKTLSRNPSCKGPVRTLHVRQMRLFSRKTALYTNKKSLIKLRSVITSIIYTWKYITSQKYNIYIQ